MTTLIPGRAKWPAFVVLVMNLATICRFHGSARRALLCAAKKMFYDSKHDSFAFFRTLLCPAPDPVDGCARLKVAPRAIVVLHRVRRALLACAVAAAGMGMLPAAHGQGMAASASLERSVKAAFLYKFLGYTDYPPLAFADPAAPLLIGVYGADEMAAELLRIVARRRVQGRAMQVRVVREGEPLAGLHLLFVGGGDAARLRSLLTAGPHGAMLVVSEAENGLENGSVINFKVVEDRVRFDVSLEAADKNGIKLSSRLLTVANVVVKGAP